MNVIPTSADEMDLGQTYGQRAQDRAQALRAIIQGRQVVYAFRLADGIIKIGCTNNIQMRRNHYGKNAEIIGFAFGGEDVEQAIHTALIPHRARGHEYYHPTPEVLAVVNDMRAEYNLEPLVA